MFTLKYHINKCKLTLTMQFILFHRDVVVGNNNSQTCLWTNKKEEVEFIFLLFYYFVLSRLSLDGSQNTFTVSQVMLITMNIK